MVKIAIYVDTSGSMNERIHGELDEDFSGESRSVFGRIFRGLGMKGRVKKHLVAKAMWQNLVPTFKDRQTKISTINSRGRSRILAPLEFRTEEELLNVKFPKPNGGTYLWKFLVEEAEELAEDSVDWLFFLISDGMDMSSPPPFSGVNGFQPCIEAIKSIGIDVEFHIIGLGLPESSVNVFRQVSGASGGSFVNIVEAGDDVEQAVEEVGSAVEESLNPIARMASRQRRQQEYLESRQEGDLDITTEIKPTPSSYSGYTYGEVTIEDTNPEQLSQWQNDLILIRGDEKIENIQSYENWVSMRSTPLFSETPGIPIDSWALSAEDVSLLASMKIDNLFTFLSQIRRSDVPIENRRIIVRGENISESLLDTLANSGARVVIYPEELPPPPPPELDDEKWERNEYDFNDNPTREWDIYPHLGASKARYSVVVDAPAYPEYVEKLSQAFERKNLVADLESKLRPIRRSYAEAVFKQSWKQFNENWVPDDWPSLLSLEPQEVGEAFCESLRIAYVQVVHEWLISHGNRPKFVLVRLSNESKSLGLHKHPCYLEFQTLLADMFHYQSTNQAIKKPRVEYW
tara:strand:+ start:4413 stop:6134 length:1722 start_codon:yes stop_codon:yes gene_type:complete